MASVFIAVGMETAKTTGDVFQLAGTVVGRIRVDEYIAEGGFAVVYRARQIALDRVVALKVLKPRPDRPGKADSLLRTFSAEARTIARLAHPNVVYVYDFGVSRIPTGDEVPWMA